MENVQRLERGEIYYQRYVDLHETTQTNLLLTGQANSGKTRWMCYIADELMNYGVQVIVVDVVGVWKQVSSIPVYEQFDSDSDDYFFSVVLPDKSIIYDLSLLLLDEQRRFVDNLCQGLWDYRVRNPSPQHIELILEEAEIYAKNLRTRLAQNIYRLAMAGRNLKIRLGYITPRIANLSTELIELSGQRYHGFSNEENSARKLRKMYGKEWTEEIKKLDVGQFLYVHTN